MKFSKLSQNAKKQTNKKFSKLGSLEMSINPIVFNVDLNEVSCAECSRSLLGNICFKQVNLTFSAICHFFKNLKILSDFDAPAKKYFSFNDKIPFRTRLTFSVPFRLNFSPNRSHFSPNWSISKSSIFGPD